MAPPISQARAALRAVHRMNSLASGSRRCALLLCSSLHSLRLSGWSAGSQMLQVNLDACLWKKGMHWHFSTASSLTYCKLYVA